MILTLKHLGGIGMIYDEFKKEFIAYIEKKLYEADMSDCKVETKIFDRVNYSFEGLCICDISKESSFTPVFDMGQSYDEYMQGKEMDDLAGDIVCTFKNTLNVCKQHSEMTLEASADGGRIRDNIIFQLVNTEQNHDVLSDVPHREFVDLSIIYRWVVKEDDKCFNSVIVNNNLADRFSLDEEQLYSLALENTRRILPPVVKPLKDVNYETADNEDMWAITNEKEIHGATSILYEDKLYTLSEKLGENIYILPVSMHGIIAVPVSLRKPEDFAMIITDNNMSRVALGERLSNQVYLYDRDIRKLSMATCTQYNKLEYPVSQYNPSR